MGTWATGSLGYWERSADGDAEFIPNLDSLIRMVVAMDESGNPAMVFEEPDGDDISVEWKVKID